MRVDQCVSAVSGGGASVGLLNHGNEVGEPDRKDCETRAEGCHGQLRGLCGFNPAITGPVYAGKVLEEYLSFLFIVCVSCHRI